MTYNIVNLLIPITLILTLANSLSSEPVRDEGSAHQAYQHAGGTQSKTKDNSVLHYTLLNMAHGVTDDKASFSQNTFQAPNGAKIFVVTIHYGTIGRVKKAFEDQLAKATRVIETGSIASGGEAKEQRAVVTFTAKDKTQASMIFITAGTELREIQSRSLQDAIEFEKRSKTD